MKHVAIDLGGRESQVCTRSQDGAIVQEARVPTKSLPAMLKGLEPSRLIVETSAEAFRIADAARAAGHDVRVVPATLARQLGVGARGIKNDRRDAQALSEVSCKVELRSVHIPSESSRELKSFCTSREVLVKTRTMLVNNVRGWLRTQLAQMRRCDPYVFPARVREHLQSSGVVLPDHLDRQLAVLETMNLQMRAADLQLKTLAVQNEVCRRMMTIPGVGPVTAARFFAAIDDPTRFRNAHAVQSYLGLTPGENSSSERKRITSITKAGPSEVRRSLVQAAWCAMRRTNEPMVIWANQLALRRGKFIAIVALARKIAGIMFALWRDGSSYRATAG